MDRSKIGLLLIVVGAILYLAVIQNIAKNDWEGVESQTDIEIYCEEYHSDYPNCIDWTTGELEAMFISKVIAAILVMVGLGL